MYYARLHLVAGRRSSVARAKCLLKPGILLGREAVSDLQDAASLTQLQATLPQRRRDREGPCEMPADLVIHWASLVKLNRT